MHSFSLRLNEYANLNTQMAWMVLNPLFNFDIFSCQNISTLVVRFVLIQLGNLLCVRWYGLNVCWYERIKHMFALLCLYLAHSRKFMLVFRNSYWTFGCLFIDPNNHCVCIILLKIYNESVYNCTFWIVLFKSTANWWINPYLDWYKKTLELLMFGHWN